MVIGFNDVGTAWTGFNPYSESNSFNTTLINGHNYTITLQNQKEPIIYGYGFGLRSRLLGYYVRFDWAWGVNDGVIMPSIKHVIVTICLVTISHQHMTTIGTITPYSHWQLERH